MKIASRLFRFTVLVVSLAWAASIPGLAQDGTLAIRVSPKQAYVFVDGRVIGEASHHRSLKLSAGAHKVDVVNYGFTSVNRNITISAGQSTRLEVTMEPIAGSVSGPFGAMTIEGADRDAVLLNGKSSAYFVGHGDEFNHDWWWKQELLVPPATYQVSVIGPEKELWSGPVEVPANQRVVIDVPKGVRKTVPWARGEKLSSLPRFKVGVASATVAVAKPIAELSAAPPQLNCGDSSQLKWSASDASLVEISDVGQVTASGEQAVHPNQATTYQLTATGSGGTATSSATVNVNNAVQANLTLTPTEVHYKRVGDKVVEGGSAALNWSTTNAPTVSIDPLGTVDASGSRTLQIIPRKTDAGTVDENIVYTLTASNGCGGTETRTAILHLIGSIEPAGLHSMRSVYFPTDQPENLKTNATLLPSEKSELEALATAFKAFIVDEPAARLVLSGHADRRGSKGYNQALSERRAELAKRFLIEQGVPESNIQTQAFGEEQNLSTAEVKRMVEQDPDLSAEVRNKALQRLETMVLANNRRVDVTVNPGVQESVRRYPFNAEDFTALSQRGPGAAAGVVSAPENQKP